MTLKVVPAPPSARLPLPQIALRRRSKSPARSLPPWLQQGPKATPISVERTLNVEVPQTNTARLLLCLRLAATQISTISFLLLAFRAPIDGSLPIFCAVILATSGFATVKAFTEPHGAGASTTVKHVPPSEWIGGASHVLQRPNVAWPTIALCVVANAAWLGAAWLGHVGRLHWAVAVPICWYAIYTLFTPMHDAAHGSVARSRWLNDGVGLVASAPFLFLYRPFRLVHLAHHRHINDEELDPDHFAGIVDGPLSEALLPVRWLTLFLHYISYCVKRAAEPRGGRWAAVLNDVGVGAPCYLYALWRGFGWSAVVFWLLPFLLGSATLVFAFDYLPHRPHKVTTDPYRATSVLRPSSRVATAILLSQNLHNIHHLAPNLPFYQYAAVWRACETELTRRGTRELPLLVHPRSAIL